MKDKIEVLRLRIATLEKLFEQPASDEKEMKRREELLMYASGLRSDWVLKLSQETQRYRRAIAVVAREVCSSAIPR